MQQEIGVNKMNNAQRDALLEIVLENDESIQELLEALFAVVNDDQLAEVLRKYNYSEVLETEDGYPVD